jgi:hypothetical protein
MQITTYVTIISSALKGWQAVSLSAMDTSAVSVIEGGSTVEVAGAFFRFATDTSATGFSAITTAATAYLALEPSGTAGSQILSAEWLSDAPVWVPEKQGYYTSAGSVIRVVGGGVKSGTSTLEPKFLFDAKQWAHNQDLRTTDAVTFNVVDAATGNITTVNTTTGNITTSNVTTSNVGTLNVSTQYTAPSISAGSTNFAFLFGTATTTSTSMRTAFLMPILMGNQMRFSFRHRTTNAAATSHAEIRVDSVVQQSWSTTSTTFQARTRDVIVGNGQTVTFRHYTTNASYPSEMDARAVASNRTFSDMIMRIQGGLARAGNIVDDI